MSATEQHAATLAAEIKRLEEIERIAGAMFSWIDKADYPPLELVEHWRKVLTR